MVVFINLTMIQIFLLNFATLSNLFFLILRFTFSPSFALRSKNVHETG